ncbi:MAG: ABC transporter ATP-binding protein [Bauldia sp.]
MLKVTSVEKTFAGPRGAAVRAVDGVSMEVEEGRFFGILGASGCGKTTLLRIIAGLENPDAGEVSIGGKVVLSPARRINLPANQRDIALVFQSYAIWPHLSVFENVAFPLRVRRVKRKTIRAEVERVLDAVALADLGGRSATTLSGGQQQRLALARAIVARPKLLLLDEPLSNIDAKLRESMRVELKRLQAEERLTTIFVTHDQTEALSLADTIAVMKDGRFLQVDAPRRVYVEPAAEAVAAFIGSINRVAGESTGLLDSDGNDLVATEWGEVAVSAGHQHLQAHRRVVLGVRPERIRIGGGERINALSGIVDSVMYYGDHQRIFVKLGDATIEMLSPPELVTARGQRLDFSVDPVDFRVLAANGTG